MTDTAMTTIEIDDSLKWELLTLIGDRLRHLDERIVYGRHRGTSGTGAELAYDRLNAECARMGVSTRFNYDGTTYQA